MTTLLRHDRGVLQSLRNWFLVRRAHRASLDRVFTQHDQSRLDREDPTRNPYRGTL